MLRSPENRDTSFLPPYSPPSSRALETPLPSSLPAAISPLTASAHLLSVTAAACRCDFPFLLSTRPDAGPHSGSAIMSVSHSQSSWTSPLPSVPHSGPFPLRSIPSWVWGKPDCPAFLPTSLMPSPVGLPLPAPDPGPWLLSLCAFSADRLLSFSHPNPAPLGGPPPPFRFTVFVLVLSLLSSSLRCAQEAGQGGPCQLAPSACASAGDSRVLGGRGWHSLPFPPYEAGH